MSDLQYQSLRGSYLDQLGYFSHRFSNGFFDQTMNSRFQKFTGDFIMQAVWHHRADSSHQRNDIAVIGVSASTMFFRKRARIVDIGVDYSDQFASGGIGIFVSMPFAEMTYTDDSNPE